MLTQNFIEISLEFGTLSVYCKSKESLIALSAILVDFSKQPPYRLTGSGCSSEIEYSAVSVVICVTN